MYICVYTYIHMTLCMIVCICTMSGCAVLSSNMSDKVPELVLANSTIVTLHQYILAAFVIKTHIQMFATPLYDIRVLLLVLTTHIF